MLRDCRLEEEEVSKMLLYLETQSLVINMPKDAEKMISQARAERMVYGDILLPCCSITSAITASTDAGSETSA